VKGGSGDDPNAEYFVRFVRPEEGAVLTGLTVTSGWLTVASTGMPVTDAMLASPADGDWLMWRRTLDNWGYSPLDQIDRRNVGELQLIWSRPLTDGVP